MSYLIGFRFKNRTGLLQEIKRNSANIYYSPQQNTHRVFVTQVDKNDIVYPKNKIKVKTNPSNNSLSVELSERTRGQMITIFLFTLGGTLLKRIRTRKNLTIINNPAIFNSDFSMNIQIDESVYTWRVKIK